MEDVVIQLFNPITLKIQTDDQDYIDEMKDQFTRFADNYLWSPKYKSGKWNGKVSMIDVRNTFPYGILMDYIRTHRQLFPHHNLHIDSRVKEIFKTNYIDIKYDLDLYPRPYQKDCIEACLKHSKGIIRSATASGKSLVIAYILKILFDNNKIKNAIIIVPGQDLILQFYQDLLEYGFDIKEIGMVYSKKKQWNKKIVISTWQSLKNKKEKCNDYDCIIVDETHGAKAYELKSILSKATKAKYRLGFTGTMHSGELNNWQTKAYLGPILREYTSGLLAEQGFISKCTVNMIDITYDKKINDLDGVYHDVKQEVFENEYRIDFIKELVDCLNHNVLILVDKVKKEGQYLFNYLNSLSETSKYPVFLSGKDKNEERNKWRKELMNRNDVALIATYGIFQQGINIPNLKYVIFASPFKAKIRVLQSIGRALRKHATKENGAFIFDICDNVKYLKKHADVRARYYVQEKFNIEEYTFKEGDPLVYVKKKFKNL